VSLICKGTIIRIKHLGMDYLIYEEESGNWNVEDAGGSRPLGLRGKGPWKTPEDVERDVRAMSPQEAEE
jgi:hypothetical protein